MKMFRRTVQRYSETPEPLSAYQRAGQEWDERIGSAREQAKNWRLAALAALSLSFLLTAGVVWQSLQSRVTPYVVEVDKLGEARAVAPANKEFQPTEAQVAWHLARFITNVRSLSSDPIIVRQNWLQAYDFATDRGAVRLNDYARANDPFSNVGARTVAAQVTSVVKASDNTYQVKWVERAYKQGADDGSTNWTAMLSIVAQSPKSAAALRKNPLGIYVNDLAWSEEINTPKK